MVLIEDRNKAKIIDQNNPNVIKMCIIALCKHMNNKSAIFYKNS